MYPEMPGILVKYSSNFLYGCKIKIRKLKNADSLSDFELLGASIRKYGDVFLLMISFILLTWLG